MKFSLLFILIFCLKFIYSNNKFICYRLSNNDLLIASNLYSSFSTSKNLDNTLKLSSSVLPNLAKKENISNNKALEELKNKIFSRIIESKIESKVIKPSNFFNYFASISPTLSITCLNGYEHFSSFLYELKKKLKKHEWLIEEEKKLLMFNKEKAMSNNNENLTSDKHESKLILSFTSYNSLNHINNSSVNTILIIKDLLSSFKFGNLHLFISSSLPLNGEKEKTSLISNFLYEILPHGLLISHYNLFALNCDVDCLRRRLSFYKGNNQENLKHQINIIVDEMIEIDLYNDKIKDNFFDLFYFSSNFSKWKKIN